MNNDGSLAVICASAKSASHIAATREIAGERPIPQPEVESARTYPPQYQPRAKDIVSPADESMAGTARAG